MKRKITKIISALSASAIVLTAMPAVESPSVSAAKLLSADFETTNDSFAPRGSAKVQWNSDRPFLNNCSLFVSERTATWCGAARDASKIMKAGSTYKMSAAVYQESGEPVEMKFTLQYKDPSGEVNYDQIALETVPDREWLTLQNDSYTVPEGASELLIYIETTESLTDFYVDAVEVVGAPAVIKPGDVNGDMSVTQEDAQLLRDFLLKKTDEAEPGADFDGSGSVNIFDLMLLERWLSTPHTPTISGDWDNYQETAEPQRLQMYKDSLYRVGNTERIRDKIAKAQKGEQVNIAYLGGSITAGGSSSTHSNCYASLSCNYFSETFGTGNNVGYVNAGMAGTSSIVGNMRVDKDVFEKNADIIFIEFAVNDQDGERFKKAYDSLVRKCVSQENQPAVVLVTLCTESGGSCQSWMSKVAENYDLPLISGLDAVQRAIKNGTYSWRDYGSGDNIHPGDGGHKLISECIGYYYRQALRSENTTDEYVIPDSSVFGSEYSTAKLMTVSEMNGLSTGSWRKGTNNPSYSENGFTYTKNGNDPLKFTTEGKGILLLFQSNSNGSVGTVDVTVNGKKSSVTGNLMYTWGGLDGDAAYYQNESGPLDVSIQMQDGSKDFVLYGIAVVK